MKLLAALLRNHPLANVTFAVVLLLGTMAYLTMPRAQDPEINFNWVSIIAALPGGSAEDVERLVTNPLEDAIKGVPDIRFVSSGSRDGVASLLVRFNEISSSRFDKRLADLRREIQSRRDELPPEVRDPVVLEITTSNGFPTASLTLLGQGRDETLRAAGRRLKADLERITGVDQVFASGLRGAEILVTPDAKALAARGLNVTDVADALREVFRDSSAGTLKTTDGAWSVSTRGVQTAPEALAAVAVVDRLRPGPGARLDEVARIERAREPGGQMASVDGLPAIALSVTKKAGINTLDLVEALAAFAQRENLSLVNQGLELRLTDDQTVATRVALGVMQTNALLGLLTVLLICWVFLGAKVSLLVSIGIPFSLAGTLAVLNALGHTLNISVLLGIVIALGMLVDDAVVVVESIYYRIERGAQAFDAALQGTAEVFKPVLSSVATTMAAFLPLMLLPGIVGKFMFVIPFVVTLALAISLAEAFWMMPTHVVALKLRLDQPSKLQAWRNRFNRRLRLLYGHALAWTLRRAKLSALVAVLLVAAAGGLFALGAVKVQFFAFDPLRLFYLNVDMPTQATLEDTLAEVEAAEQAVRRRLREGEARSVISLAGVKFTEEEPIWGAPYGQVMVSLNPRDKDLREVQAIVDDMRDELLSLPGAGKKSFTVLSGGPPAGKAISVKVRGDDIDALRRAAAEVRALVAALPGAKNVADDDVPGRPKLVLQFDHEAMRQAGIGATQLARMLRIQLDGEVVGFTREAGDKIELRVRADDASRQEPQSLLNEPLVLPSGEVTRLGALLRAEVTQGNGFIRHHNLRRAITVQADLDDPQVNPEVFDTRRANQWLQQRWEPLRIGHPGIDLDFSGELDDIDESLAAMAALFALGVGLIYLILATQFVSYWQPLMILVTVPLAFTGVTFGLALTGNPLSLYTLYGVIALTGISVNAAIVLIDAANERWRSGMGVAHATVWAARRRVVPVVITTATTIGGLFSLAVGLGGKSLLWGPVAASIVWGLAFSTLLTLFVVPLLYLLFMRRRDRHRPRRTSLGRRLRDRLSGRHPDRAVPPRAERVAD